MIISHIYYNIHTIIHTYYHNIALRMFITFISWIGYLFANAWNDAILADTSVTSIYPRYVFLFLFSSWREKG